MAALSEAIGDCVTAPEVASKTSEDWPSSDDEKVSVVHIPRDIYMNSNADSCV